MRAVEITVLGREDPRLLVAAKRRLTKPHKIARLLAGLVNSAGDRRALLLLGVSGRSVRGLTALPDDDWWDDVEASFPGETPQIHWTVIDIDGAAVLALEPEAGSELVAAYDRDNVVIVPFYDRGGIRRTRPPRADRGSPTETLPTATILGGWVRREVIDQEGAIDAFSGQIDIELGAVTGSMPDKTCSATLLMPNHQGAIELDVQIHPSSDDVGVFRHDSGIEVRSTFRVRLYVAAATQQDRERRDPASVQLVISLLLPGRAVPELRSLLLSPDPDNRGQWLV